MDGQPLPQLNELECADGAVYANVWMRDLIVRIDPATGRVTQRIEVPALLSPLEREGVDVLNGIAYDAATKTFLITGKLWPKLFRVQLREVGISVGRHSCLSAPISDRRAACEAPEAPRPSRRRSGRSPRR